MDIHYSGSRLQTFHSIPLCAEMAPLNLATHIVLAFNTLAFKKKGRLLFGSSSA
jgi:hypothetical protein